MHRGIPVTSLARTVVDLAHALGDDEWERLGRETGFQRRLPIAAIRELLERRPTRRLDALLERLAPTQSRHEDRLSRLWRARRGERGRRRGEHRERAGEEDDGGTA